MFQETEIKLRISRETANLLREHPLIGARLVESWRSGMVYNQYFDTPDKRLAKAGVALRMRKDGSQYIQTFKHDANSIAGLSVRQEWDWYLKTSELNLRLLDAECWPDSLKGIDKTHIKPIFRTDFRRTRGSLRWLRQGEEVEVEAAIDEGVILAGVGSESICELELELRSGPAIAVMELALELADDTALMPCDLSKSSRGYQLLETSSSMVEITAPRPLETLDIHHFTSEVGRCLLADLVALSEHFYTFRAPPSFYKLLHKLGLLNQYFQMFGFEMCKSDHRKLTQQLQVLLNDDELAGLAVLNEERLRQRLSKVFDRWFKGSTWGLLLISIGKWLMNCHVEPDALFAVREKDEDVFSLNGWLAKEINITTRTVGQYLENLSAQDGATVSAVPCELNSRVSFILEYFWSPVGVARPNSLLAELLALESSVDRSKFAHRKSNVYERANRELESWYGKLLKHAHQTGL